MCVPPLELEGTTDMGTIVEFPLLRSQRSLPAGTKLAAHILIFPGVRIERDYAMRNSLFPLPVISPAESGSSIEQVFRLPAHTPRSRPPEPASPPLPPGPATAQ